MADSEPIPPYKRRLVRVLKNYSEALEAEKDYFDEQSYGVKALDDAIRQLTELSQRLTYCPTGDSTGSRPKPKPPAKPARPAKPGRQPAKPARPAKPGGGRKKTSGGRVR